MKIDIGDHTIIFTKYPYPGSSVYPKGIVSVSEIKDYSIGTPITLRLKSKDVVFIGLNFKDTFLQFAKRNSLIRINRFDPWSFVLESFLDTEYTQEDDQRCKQVLVDHGFTLNEIESYRKQFKKIMISYNFDSMLWEWVHLGATDLLDAHLGKLAHKKFKLPVDDFKVFYKDIVEKLYNALPSDGYWKSFKK